MKFLLLIGVCLWCVDVMAGDPDELPNAKVVTIPLDQIWGYRMPGTRDVIEIDLKPTTERPRPTHMAMIRRQLASEPPDHEVMPGFVVGGKLRGALSFARMGITSRAVPGGNSMSSELEPYIAFFSKGCAYRIQIESVQRRGTEIVIRYRFVPRYSPESTIGFALIPLGKLPAGDYRVEISQSPMDQEYLDAGFQPVNDEMASDIVCRPFSFTVEEPPAPDKGPNKDALTIPLDKIWAYNMPGTQDARDLVDQKLIESIRAELQPAKKPGRAFVVSGSAEEAVKNAAEHLHGRKPELSGSDWIFFFSRQFGQYVHLKKVQRKDNVVEVRYEFVPHEEAVLTEHFALIPLGDLPPGEFHVKIIQTPMDQKLINMGFQAPSKEKARQTVSQSFHFTN